MLFFSVDKIIYKNRYRYLPYFSKNYIFMNLEIIQVAHYRCRAGLYLCFMVWLPSIYLLYDCSVYNKFFSKAVCVVIFVAQKKYNILAKSVKMPVLLYKMSHISSEIFLCCLFRSWFAVNVSSCMVFPVLYRHRLVHVAGIAV